MCDEANTPPPAIEVEDGEKESNKKTRRSSQRKTSHSGHSDNSKKRQKTTTESVRPRRQTRQHLKNSAPAPSENEETNAGLDMSFLDDEKTRGENMKINIYFKGIKYLFSIFTILLKMILFLSL